MEVDRRRRENFVNEIAYKSFLNIDAILVLYVKIRKNRNVNYIFMSDKIQIL
jgi:hypothetical protein